jgi:hypothetical protein
VSRRSAESSTRSDNQTLDTGDDADPGERPGAADAVLGIGDRVTHSVGAGLEAGP